MSNSKRNQAPRGMRVFLSEGMALESSLSAFEAAAVGLLACSVDASDMYRWWVSTDVMIMALCGAVTPGSREAMRQVIYRANAKLKGAAIVSRDRNGGSRNVGRYRLVYGSDTQKVSR